MKNLINFILWPAIAGLVFAVVLLGLPRLAQHYPVLSAYFPQAAPNNADNLNFALSDAIRKAAPAVVSINSQQTIGRVIPQYSADNPFRTLYREIIDESNSLGSGVIISPEGYIITSYHIFYNPEVETYSEDTTITLNDGRQLEARMLVLDEANDLALLKVDAASLPYIQPAPANGLEVGDIALAIGNPRNIGQSVSLGIVSALLRNDDSFIIQTDAAINPGNSGGALIDVNGNLIGINSTFVSESGGSEGIGFATPAGRAISLMENYIESGPSGFLGVDSELVQLRTSDGTLDGFMVSRVGVGSPADMAGIQPCDVITALNGRRVDASNGGLEFIRMLSSFRPGATVDIEIFRNGIYQAIPTTLGVGEPIIYPVFDESENCRPGTRELSRPETL